jgi:hypothetical protein
MYNSSLGVWQNTLFVCLFIFICLFVLENFEKKNVMLLIEHDYTVIVVCISLACLKCSTYYHLIRNLNLLTHMLD